MMREHSITVARTARYFVLGDTSHSLREVWLVCHGYGQLAFYFLKTFEAIASDGRLIVAPEGLSRFYVRGFSERVGASWMTREDRLHEMEDYIKYLDAVCEQASANLARGSLGITALGFSQGTATVSRWASRTSFRVGRLILWGGLLPPDLDLQNSRAAFENTRITSVVGNTDEFADTANLEKQHVRLAELGITHTITHFDGWHELNVNILKKLAE
jgi:predicted esterase